MGKYEKVWESMMGKYEKVWESMESKSMGKYGYEKYGKV